MKDARQIAFAVKHTSDFERRPRLVNDHVRIDRIEQHRMRRKIESLVAEPGILGEHLKRAVELRFRQTSKMSSSALGETI